MPKQKLFDDDSDGEVELKTENEYAKKYDQWRGKEEMHKLEQKYGSNALKSDASLSSDSDEESDEPPEVSEEMETQFLKTLALLKKKDPRIYDPEFKFFEEQQKESVKPTKEKTLTFADSDEDDDDDDDGNIFSIEKKAEMLEDNVKETKSQAKKDGDLKDFLTGKVEHFGDAEKDLEPLKALWSDPKLNEGEAFLRDYILNKKYLEEGSPGAAAERLRDDADLGADEAAVEEQDRFERAYNFRFEEPDQEYLKRFPRTMSYIRPKDERRGQKRAELRTRKQEEKARRMDELARLRALKLQEIQEKIARIKEVTGNDELAFKDEDIEGDFDPAEHDRRMRAIFDEQYYGEGADEEKPVFPDLDKELEIENWDEYEPDQEEKEAQDFSVDEPHCEDAEFNMDADFNPSSARASLLEQMRASLGKKRRNRKNKSKLARLLAQDKPKYIPLEEDRTYEEYMKEYYDMDCEDIIGGDLPTRFKYREVVPNDFGLTIEEILLADDKELTQWVPLKRVVRHKPESAQRGEVHAYAQKAADKQLKKKILPSLFKNLPEEPELVISKEENKKKKKNRRKKNKQKATGDVENKSEQNIDNTNENEPQANENSEQVSEAENDLVEEKVGKKKGKRKNKEVSEPSVDSSIELDESVEVNNEEVSKKAILTKKENAVTKVVSKIKHKQETIENGNNKVESKADSSIDSSGLSKRQKKNLKKKLKKKEKAKNAKLNGDSPTKAAGKKRKLSESEQVPNKKQKNSKHDSEPKNNKPFNKDKQIKPIDKENKNKVETTLSEEKPNKKDKPKNKDIQKNKDKFKNKNKQNNGFKNKVKQLMNKSKDNDKTENPMSNLSDERLKAYGLNPKKYRGFLKYKKF